MLMGRSVAAIGSRDAKKSGAAVANGDAAQPLAVRQLTRVTEDKRT